MPDFAKALGAAKGASTLIRLDASSPRRRFSCVALGAGTVFDRPGPKTVLPGWRCPDAFGLVSSDVLALVRKASPWRKPREPVASDVVATVDQSDIRVLGPHEFDPPGASSLSSSLVRRGRGREKWGERDRDQNRDQDQDIEHEAARRIES